MSESQPQRRWFHPTPAWLVFGSVAVTGLLFLSERWRWFWFNEHKGYTVLIAVAGVGVVLAVMLLWWLVALVFRWRFQFGIRTLLVLTVAVALPFSWLGVEMKKAKEQREIAKSLESMEGLVRYDYQEANVKAPGPKVLRQMLGLDFFSEIAAIVLAEHDRRILRDGSVFSRSGNDKITDHCMECLKTLPHLKELYLLDAQVSDAGLEYIKGLGEIKVLHLCCIKITDAGLRAIKDLTQLEELMLDGDQITDAGMEYLAHLAQLKRLSLEYTAITDTGLEQLVGLTELQQLYLEGTNVTDSGWKRLSDALPKVQRVRPLLPDEPQPVITGLP